MSANLDGFLGWTTLRWPAGSLDAKAERLHHVNGICHLNRGRKASSIRSVAGERGKVHIGQGIAGIRRDRFLRKSFYCLSDESSGKFFIGVQPYEERYLEDYTRMRKRIGLKKNLGWKEVQDLQRVFKRGGIWENYPAEGFTLIAAELKVGEEDQRLDMLYLGSEGELLPCELKIGGEAKDTHGQLIRYMSDLFYQKLDLDWVRTAHEKFVSSIKNDVAKKLQRGTFETFLGDNKLGDKPIRLLPQSGLMMDESFKPQCRQAVRYLNDVCGFSIRLIRVETFVSDDWSPEQKDFMLRIDFTEDE